MNILDHMMAAIFGRPPHVQQPAQSSAGSAQGHQSAGIGASASAGSMAGQAGGTALGGAPQAPGRSAQAVDIEAVLTEKAAKKHEKLDWRRSIVDLMKVLDLDSSLNARKQLAEELGYTGELNGSAEMNMWLHRQVMKKVAANGGKVPADLMV